MDRTWPFIVLIISECRPAKPKVCCRADLPQLPVEKPTISANIAVLKNPACAGAFV
jgi:hypothetical protein